MRKLLICLMALALVAVFTMPVAAKDKIKFYGAVKMYTFNKDISKEQMRLGNGSVATANESDDDLRWRLHGSHTNFGAKGQTGALKYRVEFAWAKGNTERHWYAEWDFGPASVLVGNTSAIEHMSIGKMEPLTDMGTAGGSNRTQQIQLKFKVGPAKIILAASNPPTNGGNDVLRGTSTGVTADANIPKLGARVEFGVGPLKFDVVGLYNSYEERSTTTNQSIDIDSSAFLMRVRANFGPIELAGSAYTTSNVRAMRNTGAGSSWGGLTSAAWFPRYYDGSVQDTESVGWGIRGTYKFNKMFAINVQTGSFEHERPLQGGPDDEIEQSHFAVSLPITLVKGFTLMPFYEVEEYETRTTATRAAGTTDQGDITAIGAMWLLRF